MSLCPKCNAKLIKRKSDKSYNCRRHGLIRYINTPGKVFVDPFPDVIAQPIPGWTGAKRTPRLKAKLEIHT